MFHPGQAAPQSLRVSRWPESALTGSVGVACRALVGQRGVVWGLLHIVFDTARGDVSCRGGEGGVVCRSRGVRVLQAVGELHGRCWPYQLQAGTRGGSALPDGVAPCPPCVADLPLTTLVRLKSFLLLGPVPHEERKVLLPAQACSHPRPCVQVTALGRCVIAPHHLALVSKMWPRLRGGIPVVVPEQ